MRYSDAAYRKTAPGGTPGFQRPLPPYRPPSLPANDNLPKPANDNRPKPLRGLRRGKLLPLARGLYALYRYLQENEPPWQEQSDDYGDWRVDLLCGPRASPWFGSPVNSCVWGVIDYAWIGMPRAQNGRYHLGAFQPGYEDVPPSMRGDWAIHISHGPTGGVIPAVPGVFPHWPVTDPFRPTTPIPSVDPFIVPPQRPLVIPRPIPWRILPGVKPNPWRSPQEQPQRGPAPSPRPRPRPGQKPYEQPSGGVEVVVTPEGAVSLKPRSAHKRLPPPRGEPERKASIGAKGLASALAGSVTEGLDLLNAVYYALPEDVRNGCYGAGRKDGSWFTPQEMAACIAANASQIDLGQLAVNLALNQAQDVAIGALSPTDRLDWSGRALGGVLNLW